MRFNNFIFRSLIASSILLPLVANAQTVEISRSKRTGRVIFATVAPSATTSTAATAPITTSAARTAAAYAGSSTATTDPTLVADTFIATFGATVGVPSPTKNLVPYRSESDRLGMNHVRYEHRFQGVPVLGSDIVVHLGKTGQVESASANVLPGLKPNMTVLITAKAAKDLALALWKKEHGKKFTPKVVSSKKFVYAPALLKNDTSTASYLVWEVKVRSDIPPTSDIYYLDARSGALRLKTTDIYEIDRRVSDCSGQPGSNNCYSSLMTMEFGYQYVFGRLEGSAEYGPNPRLLPAAYVDNNTAYNLFGLLQTFYQQALGRNGGNGQGGTGNGITQPVSKSWAQTYVDFLSSSSCPAAAFDNGRLAFCKGTVVPDVFAHEYGHSVPYYSITDGSSNPIGMVYQGESGALNESYADISAELFEKWYSGSNDWVIGASAINGPYRSLSNPPAIPGYTGSYSDRFHSPSVACGANDNGGVHLNSTIPTKAAYLLTEGGSFNGCSIGQIGPDKVYKIWYRAMSQYYVSAETFNGAFFKLNQACQDLYGSEPSTCNQVRRALQSVEMDQPGRCSGLSGTVPSCVDAIGW